MPRTVHALALAGRLVTAADEYTPDAHDSPQTVLHDMVLAICDRYAMELAAAALSTDADSMAKLHHLKPTDAHLRALFTGLDTATAAAETKYGDALRAAR